MKFRFYFKYVLESMSELERLRAENESLRRQLGLLTQGDRSVVRIHYMYASPLVLLDSLGSTVIENFDPIRVESEFRRIAESGVECCMSVASPSNFLRFKYWLEEDRLSDTILHISMHTVDDPSRGSVRCALEDDYGRGHLMSAEEFASLLSPLETVRLVFVNACKSREIACAILAVCPSVNHVVCLDSHEPVLESAAQLFASEFYPLLVRESSIAASFERAKRAVRSSANARISKQADLFLLLHSSSGNKTSLHFSKKKNFIKKKNPPLWMGFLPPAFSLVPEDFIGRQTDIVRLCSVLFAGAGRRVCAITGTAGIGKRTFISEACKYLASPGARQFNGGVCVVDCGGEEGRLLMNADAFFAAVTESLKATVASVRFWNGLESVAAQEKSQTDDTLMRSSYKVFWAETFSNASDLGFFLNSYQISLPPDSVARLFGELRNNGTQLQDWGAGKLVRVVHVVRLLIQRPDDEDNLVLLEKREGEKSTMLSKKFDPVFENVLEVARIAVRKELGSSLVQGILRLELRDRKPFVEINSSSPSYPSLATKYVLYTVNVTLSGLPSGRFETQEEEKNYSVKKHVWEWTCPQSETLARLLTPSADDAAILENFTMQDNKSREKEFFQLLEEWNFLCQLINRKAASGTINSALVLLNAGDCLSIPLVRTVLGKALVRHTGLKILFTHKGFESKSVFNLTTSSVSYKIIHFPLSPLQPIDSAVLFTRRIHRPLFPRDWWRPILDPPPPLLEKEFFHLEQDEPQQHEPLLMNVKSSKGVANLARLARHPLLLSTQGLPSKILAVAQHVTLDLTSINELVNT